MSFTPMQMTYKNANWARWATILNHLKTDQFNRRLRTRHRLKKPNAKMMSVTVPHSTIGAIVDQEIKFHDIWTTVWYYNSVDIRYVDETDGVIIQLLMAEHATL